MRVKHELIADAGSKALQAAPGVAASTSIALGAVNPQWFVVIPTAVFVLLQIAHFCWKWHKEWKAKPRGRSAE